MKLKEISNILVVYIDIFIFALYINFYLFNPKKGYLFISGLAIFLAITLFLANKDNMDLFSYLLKILGL